MSFYGLWQALTKLAEFRVSVRLEILREGSARKGYWGHINDRLGWES
jgi:hypothetical protein